MRILVIASGGQTGADRGGLEAAIHCGIPHAGWCPKGRKAEDGPIPARYALTEMQSSDYLARTEANVVDTDATVIFTNGALGGGSLKTAEFAKKHGKPWIHVDVDKLTRDVAVKAIVDWLEQVRRGDGVILNVAGQRASKAPQLAGIVKAWMIDVISEANGKLFYPIGEEFYEEDMTEPGNEPPQPEYDSPQENVQEDADTLPSYHPKTIAEAVDILMEVLPVGTKQQVLAIPRDEIAVQAHFGLSLWIRNVMIHQNENQVDLMADVEKGCRDGKWDGYAEADSVSGVIIEQVWDRLHAK